MPNTSGLNITKGQGFNKLKEALSGGNYIDKLRAGASITAGDDLVNNFNPDDPETKESKGYVDNTDGIAISSAPSQFNPFNVFRYKRFGLSDEKYEIEKHLDGNLYGADIGGLNEDEDRSKANLFAYVKDLISEPTVTKFNIGDFQRTVRNPSAKQIIDASKDAEKGIIGPAPYAYNDFLYCKHYGKIPNNRLVTLRRYPQPVEDNLFVPNKKDDIQVPIAQALTYYGTGTDNTLKSVLPISWDMKWTPLESKVEDIQGNEVLIDNVIEAAGVTDETTQKFIRTAVAVQTGSSSQKAALELAGYDAALQEYISKAYNTENGPYWNRVLGPVNVINQSRKRDRGMGQIMFETPVQLKFTFALRSFNFINPKVAMLDLISNFLSLTYNTAPFWEGGYRYFPKPGVKVSLAGQDLINEGKILEGIQVTLEEWLKDATGEFASVLNELAAAFNTKAGIKNDKPTTKTELTKDPSGKLKDKALALANGALSGKVANLMQTPLSYRSLLEGRPIGEWHMTVGNPLDPFAVMGNLICTACTMEFSEELGADDFPKEISFNVTLKHGKPRAKQDLESIFNLGGGPLSFSKLKPPSSAQQTFGTDTSGNPKFGVGAPLQENDPSAAASTASTKGLANVQFHNTGEIEEKDNGIAPEGTNIYKERVSNHYGSQYGNSTMLNDYIKKTQS